MESVGSDSEQPLNLKMSSGVSAISDSLEPFEAFQFQRREPII
jgi:hypothetical protein